MKAAGCIKSGKVFTLQVKMADPAGDPGVARPFGRHPHDGDGRG